MKVLIVEDDRTIAKGLARNLEFEGYEVLLATDGEEGLRAAREVELDLIILDVMLPKLNGYEVCRRLRAEGICTPIIMLTVKGQEEERVLGFKLGADDYVVKPFSVMELMERIRAVLRRTRGMAPSERVEFGDVVLDFGSLEAWKEGVSVHLSPKEFGIMRVLTERAGRPVSRKELLTSVWGYDVELNTRTVDAHIASLRKKLEDDPSEPRHILTVHGVGYKFVF